MNVLGTYKRSTVNEVLYPAGGKLGPRIQRNLQLVYVWKGEATVWIDGVRRDIRAGQQILLLPHHRERFRFSTRTPTHHGWSELHAPALPERLERFLREVSPSVVVITERTKHLVAEALTLRSASDAISIEVRRLLVESILLEHIRVLTTMTQTPLYSDREFPVAFGSSMSPQSHHTPSPVQRALQVIHERFAEIGAVTEIASAVNCSPQHVARLFARHIGASPGSVLWRVRTEHAVELIRATGLPLEQVAAQSGFQTTSHLSRRVKEHTGFSPRELRDRERS